MEFSKEFLRQFEPVGQLGEGGMARVILANQTSLQRQVAIKFMAGAAFPAAEATERFMREAKMLAKLDHPNILKIYDLGVEDEQPYLVLEYVRGESVRERLNREGPLKSDEAARIALMVARGLAYAHDKSILHRDVKPENVLLSIEGGVKLLDFGLGKLLELSENISHGGVILGTPAYLAPELIMGNPPSEASDLYTVGILLYEMLTGVTPFGDSAEPDKLLERTKIEMPTEPLERIRDRRIVEILARSLRRQTTERYQQACELVESLELYLGVSADPRIRRSTPGMMRPSRGSGTHRRKGKSSKTTRILREMPVRPVLALLAFVGALAIAIAAFTMRAPRPLGDPGDLEVMSGITGARVRWRSADAYVGTITATSPNLPEVALREPQPTTTHDVLLSNLASSRLYELKVGDESSARYPAVRFTTASKLEIPPLPVLEPQAWDRAVVNLELNIPATVVARPDNEELTVTGGEKPSTSHKLIVNGPGAGIGLFGLDLEVTSIEGKTERRSVALRGAYEGLLEYARSGAFTSDLEMVGAAWLAASTPEEALIAARAAIGSSRSLRTRQREIDWLARCLTEPGVSFTRAARVYELLSDLERFNRIIPAAIAHNKEGKVPLHDIPPLIPIATALESFAPSTVELVPDNALPPETMFRPLTRLRPSIRAHGQDVTTAHVLLDGLPADPRTAPTKLPFDSFISNLPDSGRIRVTLKGRCFSSALFMDLEINGMHKLRFFGAGVGLNVSEPLTGMVKMASDSGFEKAIPSRALSVTVPVKMFRRGKNAFVLTGGIVAPQMAAFNGPCLPTIHWVSTQLIP